jgi:hypothetical protein
MALAYQALTSRRKENLLTGTGCLLVWGLVTGACSYSAIESMWTVVRFDDRAVCYEAGDLPGWGDELDHIALGQLVEANSGRRGWTYTHKPVTPKLKEALLHANRGGFAIALSTEGIIAADAAASLGVAPVVTILGADAPAPPCTPKGRRLVVCQGGHGTTCERCGLCAIPDRDFIVAFRAHGQWKDLVGKLAAG